MDTLKSEDNFGDIESITTGMARCLIEVSAEVRASFVRDKLEKYGRGVVSSILVKISSTNPEIAGEVVQLLWQSGALERLSLD